MKKILSCLLVLALLATTAIPALAAGTADPPQTQEPILPIVFVTGIGQLWSHLLDENGNYVTETNSKGEEEPIEYNLFYPELSVLKQPKIALATANFALRTLILSPILNRDLVPEKSLKTVLSALFSHNIIDENGDLPSDVEPPARNYALSQYNARDKYNFYRSIPCKDLLRGIGEENVYCYYHSAFSFLERDADGLDAFLNDVVLKDRPDTRQVVLIPMSMGAAVVSDYLAKYGGKNQVKRVISVVGAWNGSDLVADLIEHKFSDDAPELLYHTVFPELLGDPWGRLLCIYLYAFSKRNLRSVLDSILSGFVDTMILHTPSLLALVPTERYPSIEEKYLSGDAFATVRAQARAYYEAQRTLPQRMAQLQAQGTEFFFICGYGLGFGGADDSEYPYFRFMQSASQTNSDEIISIRSTAPGASFAPAGQSLGRTGAYISPDGSVDLSTSFAPDRTWLFYRQKHQLDFNNTALRLAMDIALGNVTDVASSAEKYPQFNNMRDVKPLIRGNDTCRDRLQRFINANKNDPQKADDVARAQDALDRCNAMLENTHNDPQADAAVIKYAQQLLEELYPQTPQPEPEQKWSGRVKDAAIEKLLDLLIAVLPPLHEALYQKYGAAGIRDKYGLH